jgi:thioredoxin 1
VEELMAELADPSKILPTELKSQAEFDACLSENELVVVDFTATWCGPCVGIAPKYKALAKQQEATGKNLLKGESLVKFTKVDSGTKDVIKSAEVNCYPTFHLYRKGEKVMKLEGADEDALKLAIKKLINPEFVEVHYAVAAESKEAFDKILADHKTVVVDFTATWCPPCRMIKPIFEELAEQHKDDKSIAFVKVDVDANDETAAEYKVQSMPTFKFFVDGKEVHGFSGADVQKLKDKIAELAK